MSKTSDSILRYAKLRLKMQDLTQRQSGNEQDMNVQPPKAFNLHLKNIKT